jgi:hypothetical protein
MMDSGMGKMEMAPPMNIAMMMPPMPTGADGVMMPMPESGPMPMAAGETFGEAPGGVAGSISENTTGGLLTNITVLAGVPPEALANLTAEERNGVSAVFRDSGSGLSLSPPMLNMDGSPNENPSLVFLFTPPSGEPGPPPGSSVFFGAPIAGGGSAFPGGPGAEGAPAFPGGPGAEGAPAFPGGPGAEGAPAFPGGPGAEGAPAVPGAPIAGGPPAVPGTPVAGGDATECVATADNNCEIAEGAPIAGGNPAVPAEPIAGGAPVAGGNPAVPAEPIAGGAPAVPAEPIAELNPAPGAIAGLTMVLTAKTHPDGQLINVQDSTALTYLVNNPDIMVHARKIVGASGISPGRDFQIAMEQVALEHYNAFGIKEGRHLDGSRSLSVTVGQVINAEAIISISSSPALTYLVNNPDVMVHARKVVGASGIPAGRNFQRAMERVAIEHYNTFGAKEGRAGLGQ